MIWVGGFFSKNYLANLFCLLKFLSFIDLLHEWCTLLYMVSGYRTNFKRFPARCEKSQHHALAEIHKNFENETSFVLRQLFVALTYPLPPPFRCYRTQCNFTYHAVVRIHWHKKTRRRASETFPTRRCAITPQSWQREDFLCDIAIAILYKVVRTHVLRSCIYKRCAACCVLSRVLSLNEVVLAR